MTHPTSVRRPAGPEARLLVIEAEPNILELLASSLRFAGFHVTEAASGNEGLRSLQAAPPDLVILDVALPDMDGFTVIRRLRGAGHQVPVIFLTARDATADKISGLALGGDDYITKPFSLEETVQRIRAVLRRTAAHTGIEITALRYDTLELDAAAHLVHRDGHRVDLSATEFRLLRYLMLNQEHVVSKAQILDNVWEDGFTGDPSIIESYISYLRRKLEPHGPRLIHTVRGVGYVLRLDRTS
ncbi:response regulator transcription factor [Streptomyces sp. NPDC048331]|uniref:response regulator transcription factor n=1 Tax=Streptomyces sp. NPDC048331 TaxID=3365534 RepID=UPI00371D630E